MYIQHPGSCRYLLKLRANAGVSLTNSLQKLGYQQKFPFIFNYDHVLTMRLE